MFNHTDENGRKENESKIKILKKNQQDLEAEFGSGLEESNNDLHVVLRNKTDVDLPTMKEDKKMYNIIINSRNKVNF